MPKVRKLFSHIFAAAIIIGPPAGSVLFLASPANASHWNLVDADCHNAGVAGSSQYTWCWSKKKRVNDSTPKIDVFAFRMTLSGNATNNRWLNRLWVEMDPRDTSPNMSWYSADPFKPDDAVESSSDCRNWQWTIGVSMGIEAAFSESGSVCAKTIYTPKLYSEQGHHAAILNKSNCWSDGVVKKVAASVLVKTAAGKVPLWDSSKHGMDVRTAQGHCTSY